MENILKDFKHDQKELIHILHRIQEDYGYISPQAISAVAEHIKISENEIYGVLTFYKAFSLEPRGKHIVTVCMGTACHVRGGQQLLNTLEHRLGVHDGETTPDKHYDLNRVACLGCCALAPVVKIDEKVYSQLSVLKLRELLDEYDEA